MRLSFGHKKTGNEDQLSSAGEYVAVEDEAVRGLSNLYSPDITEQTHIRDIADVLAEMDAITAEQLEQLRSAQMQSDSDIEELILNSETADVEDVLKAKAELFEYPFVHVTPEDVEKEVFDLLGIDYIRLNHIMPISIQDDMVTLATDKPGDVFAIDAAARQIGKKTEIVICTPVDIEAVCDEFDEEEEVNYDVSEIMNDMDDIEVVQDEDDDQEDLEQSAGRSPVIKFVNYLISNAIKEGASDIHIEPKEKYTRIRLRIDGVLFESMQSPAKMHPAVVSRIKIMSNLDISERRIPQDGKISVIIGGRGVDLRISILPTSHGEKVVIRILDSQSIMRGLDSCGMEADVLEQFRDQIALPHGILLVTGPTGSGKSTTLYSALGQMDGESLNVSTVEDPVEYDLEFCNQVQVIDKVGMTFAAALRSLLRQDPDIIMIGEIRDVETARIAVQAALTGHLVLSTLHTNDAPSTISRLVNIGIDPYLIAASLNGILAQRLVRKICDHCKEPYQAPDSMLKHLKYAGIDPKKIYHGAGCEKCRNSGYSGRVGIYELLIVDDHFKELINKDPSVDSMKRAFATSGCSSLFDDGMQKVKKGLTTIEEVLRVTEVFNRDELDQSASVVESNKEISAEETKPEVIEIEDQPKAEAKAKNEKTRKSSNFKKVKDISSDKDK